jgi:hypothetical protein
LGAVPALGITDGDNPIGATAAAAAASTGSGNAAAETPATTTEQKSVDEIDSAGTGTVYFKKIVR